jgi:hypothetical protein
MILKKTDPIKTVLVISMGFLLIFLVTHWQWALFTSFAIGLIGVFSTYLSKKVDFLWMKLAYLLSLIVPNILLGAVFYLILFPISALSKLFRSKDPLVLTNRLKSTYIATKKSFDKESFEKPW